MLAADALLPPPPPLGSGLSDVPSAGTAAVEAVVVAGAAVAADAKAEAVVVAIWKTDEKKKRGKTRARNVRRRRNEGLPYASKGKRVNLASSFGRSYHPLSQKRDVNTLVTEPEQR